MGLKGSSPLSAGVNQPNGYGPFTLSDPPVRLKRILQAHEQRLWRRPGFRIVRFFRRAIAPLRRSRRAPGALSYFPFEDSYSNASFIPRCVRRKRSCASVSGKEPVAAIARSASAVL